MTEQLTTLRRSSGDRPHPDHGDDRERACSRSHSRGHPANFAGTTSVSDRMPCVPFCSAQQQGNGGQSLMAANDTGHLTRCLFVMDNATKVTFLIDTEKMVRGSRQRLTYELLAANDNKHTAPRQFELRIATRIYMTIC